MITMILEFAPPPEEVSPLPVVYAEVMYLKNIVSVHNMGKIKWAPNVVF